MSDSKGVRYGISNAHYAVYTEGTGGALGTYATPVAMKGATALTATRGRSTPTTSPTRRVRATPDTRSP